MMYLNFLFIAAALIPSSIQARLPPPPPRGPPPPPNQRPDACAKAISSGPSRPPQGVRRSDVAKSDCSSFLSQIVVPCPVTSTSILVSTKTANGATRTNTVSTTITTTALTTAVVTTDQSIFSTDQQTQFTTLVLPQNSTALTTETATTTSTVLETVFVTTAFSTAVVTSTVVVASTPAALQRRETSVSVLPDRPHPTTPAWNGTLIARQNNGQCNPSVFTPDQVPEYASSCRDLKSYSSACRQLGVVGKTMTLAPSTSFYTKTSLMTITPTVIVNTTKTFQATTTKGLTQPVTRLHTSITNLTATSTLTTTSTSILTSTITSLIGTNTTLTTTLTTSVIATSTTLITPTPTTCTSNFRLHVNGTSQTVGSYIRSFGESEKMGFTSNASLAGTFSLDASSHLYEPSTNLYPNTDAGGLYYVYAETAATIDENSYLYLTCKLSEKGEVGCTASNGGDTFYWCPVIGPPDALIFGNEASKLRAGGGDCVGLKVGVECM